MSTLVNPELSNDKLNCDAPARVIERSNLIGKIVWNMVKAEAENKTKRSIQIIAGLRPEHLAGISRMKPTSVSFGKIKLAIRRDIDNKLTEGLPEDHLTDRPAVHFRNSAAADIILFAVSDEERETVGSSLNPVYRIDRNSIQDQVDLWADEIISSHPGAFDSEDRRNWIKALLKGFNQSGVTKELDQFAEFVLLMLEKKSLPWVARISESAPALHLPTYSFPSIPKASGGTRSKIEQEFRSMFRTAEQEIAGFAYLLDRNDKKIDTEELLESLEKNEKDYTPDQQLQANAIGDLIADQKYLRHGSWRPSQERFCQVVNWKAFGVDAFGVQRRRRTPDLSERTLKLLSEEYPEKLEQNKETQQYLEDLQNRDTTPEQDQAFFKAWQDELQSGPNFKLYEAWRRHLFPDEMSSDDLQVAILEGIHAVLMKTADDEGKIATGCKIQIKARNCEKVSSWSSLDKRVYALFRQEAQLLQRTLSNHIVFDFGRWLDDEAIERVDSRRQNKKDAQQIEFEVGLISKDGLDTLPRQRIRVFWKPFFNSIAMAWPEDINGLYQSITDSLVRVHASTFAMKPSGNVGESLVSLQDTGSFVDVTGGEDGRTADPASVPIEEDFFGIINKELKGLEADRLIDKTARRTVANALAEFQHIFTQTIEKLAMEPETLYHSNLIERQANAFGHLCQTARENLASQSSARRTTMRKITQFGMVTSATSKQGAIITAWHPLRLLERQAKARNLAQFVDILFSADMVSDDGLKRACDERRYFYKKWFFPEVISVGFKPYVTLQDCAGYSLAVPVETVTSDPQKLENSASIASKQFLAVSDWYLKLNPHEEGNFSTAIFNADTVSLPSLIAQELEDRMAKNNYLRCSLLITHDNPERMRKIYAIQNARLRGQNLDEVTEGFLSRLRIGVGKGDVAQSGNRRNSTDIVFLHDAFFRHSQMAWDYRIGDSDSLPEEIDFRDVALPRRQTSDTGGSAKMIEMSLTVERPPRVVAKFLDLCCVCQEDVVFIRDGYRALPIRRVSWDTETVRRTINRAHEIGEWVVSVDSMSSRKMLSDNRIKVIRDVQLPNSELRVLVSSYKPSENLLRHIQTDFENMVDPTLHNNAMDLAEKTVAVVVEVCGQKVLGSGRSKNAAREVVGLAAATSLIHIDKAKNKMNPIWFSLDDNRAFFGLTGKMADTLALTVTRAESGRFVVNMSVVEAKCVSASSSPQESKLSRDQVSSTLKKIKANFVNQKDPVAQEAWGIQLLHLMSLRPQYVHFFEDRYELDEFHSSLARGDVDYYVEGRSVVVIYDDDSSGDSIAVTLSPSDDNVWQYQVRQRALGRLMKVIDDPYSGDAPELPLPEGLPDQTTLKSEMLPKTKAQKIFSGVQQHRLVSDTVQKPLPESEPASDIVSVGKESENIDVVDKEPTNLRIRPELEKVLKAAMNRHGGHHSKEQEAKFADMTAKKLQAALVELGMHADLKPDPTISTPNGVLVNFAGHSTLTVKKLKPKLLELKTTFGLDVTDIRAGLGRISLFVAAQNRRVVDLSRVWLEANWPESCPDSTARFLVGLREDTGDPLWLNLQDSHGGNGEHAPHTLIAGETGSGKGVLTQNLLLQMIAFNRPENLKLYVIDPKFGVDFFWISGAPHLVREIVTTQEEASHLLDEIVEEMDRRYELFVQMRVPKISEYNELVPEEKKLPLIIVVHDEMADWMAGSEDYRRVVQNCFTRLASKARACGIHIIMITQRAAQDAIPVGIRDNLGNRLCLKVAGTAGSKLALGVEGAECLLGKGHVAARLGGDKPSGEEYFIAQVPFASTEDLKNFASAALANEDIIKER